MALGAALQRAWWQPRVTPLAALLLPLSWLFAAVSALRRIAYRAGWMRRTRVPVPVVIVGNIAVGGAGKTPLVCALVLALRERGFHPGIVSRGHGRADDALRIVRIDDHPRDVGDEPLILAATGAPVCVGRRRGDAVRALLAAHPEVDVIVSDDGLQHYALDRDVEIAVVDGARGVGNGLLLPAGPLREPVSRLASVDAVVELRGSGTGGSAALADRQRSADLSPSTRCRRSRRPGAMSPIRRSSSIPAACAVRTSSRSRASEIRNGSSTCSRAWVSTRGRGLSTTTTPIAAPMSSSRVHARS